MKIVWEPVQQDQAGHMCRTRTPGGWLVMHTMDVQTTMSDGSKQEGYEWRSALCFVPDPQYQWLPSPQFLADQAIGVMEDIKKHDHRSPAEKILGWLEKLDKFVSVFA